MKVLVALGEGIGNMVMATPVIAAIAELGHEVDIMVRSNWPDGAELFRGWPTMGRVFDSEPNDSTMETYELICNTVWGSVQPRVGIPSMSAERSWQIHEVEANMVLARRLGFKGQTPPCHVEVDADSVPSGPFFIAAPGCNASEFWQRKKYPHWRRLMMGLMSSGYAAGMRPLILGVRKDIEGWWDDFDYCCDLPLRKVTGIIAGAKFVIAIDNGLAHIAAAVGTPVFVMFGATSPIKNRPWGRDVLVVTVGLECQPCQHDARRWDHCGDWRCMNRLDPEIVLRKIEQQSKN